MKTERAIELALGVTNLAKLFGITPGAVSQWGAELPELRRLQLGKLRPEWFESEPQPGNAPGNTINQVAGVA